MLILALIFSATTFAQSVGFWELQGVRKAFEIKDGKWVSAFVVVENEKELKTAPAKYATPEKWTLFFDGKTYGELNTKSFPVYDYYKDNGLQKVTSKEPTLPFRKLEDNFIGFDGKLLRPILASDLKSISDPDVWKRAKGFTKVDKAIVVDLGQRFKSEFSKCADKDCEKTIPYSLAQKDVVLKSAYQDKAGNLLVAVTFKFSHPIPDCEESPDDKIGCSGFGPFWYLQAKEGKPFYLRYAKALIDAADLNNDGVSEFVFFDTGYNRDGYVLCDGKTKEVVTSFWSYH